MSGRWPILLRMTIVEDPPRAWALPADAADRFRDDRGWGDADLAALQDQYGMTRRVKAWSDALNVAGVLSDLGLAPADVLAWMAITLDPDSRLSLYRPCVLDWMKREGQMSDPGVPTLVDQYTHAAYGRQDLARAAFTARLSPAELARQVESGTADVTALRLLAGLLNN